VFLRSRYLSLPWARWIQSTASHPISLSSILILYSHLHLGLPSALFHSGFLTKTLYTCLVAPMRATCPAHLILLELITLVTFGEAYKLWSYSLCSLLQSPATSSLLGPNTLDTLFSHTPTSCSCVIFRNELCFYGGDSSAPCSTTKLEDRPFSAVRYCLFNIFAAILHVCRPSSPFGISGSTMSWW
jgi:hypothetical protein